MKQRRTLLQRLAQIAHSLVAAVRESALEAAMYCAELDEAATERRLGATTTEPVPPAAEPALRDPVALDRTSPAVESNAEAPAFAFEPTREPARV